MNSNRLFFILKVLITALLLCLVCVLTLFAQSNLIDSLSLEVGKAKNDTSKLDIMYSLSRQLVITGQYERVLAQLDEMQDLVNKLSGQTGAMKKSYSDRLKSETARIQNLKGVVYHRQSKFKEALGSYFLALRAREELGDEKGMGMACNNIAGTYYVLSDLPNQLKYLELARANFEKIDDKTGLGQTNYNLALYYLNQGDLPHALETNIKAQRYSAAAGDQLSLTHCMLLTGSIYHQLGNYTESNKYFLDALQLANNTGDKVGRAFIFSNLGINYKEIGDFTNAMSSYKAALSLQLELDDKKNIADNYQHIGTIFTTQKERAMADNDSVIARQHIDSAFYYYDKARIIYESLNEKIEYTNTIIRMGNLYTDLKQYDQAFKYISKGFHMSDETGDRRDRMQAYKAFSNYYESKGELDEALRYHKLFSGLKDSILNESSAKSLLELNTRYETEKKEKQIGLLEKQKQIDNIELALREEQLHKQELTNKDKTQQLLLVSKDNEIKNLSLQQQKIALQHQLNETEKKQKEVELLKTTSELQRARIEQVSLQKRAGIAGIIVLVMFGGFSYYRYKQRKKLSEKLAGSLQELQQTQEQLIETEKRREQENIRLRISRDIHDEIGSNLTKITLLSEMVATGDNVPVPELKRSVSDISAYAREVNDSLSEIVWAVNPGQDTLDSLLAYMRSHIHSFLQDTGMKYSIDFPELKDDLKLDPELKRGVFLVLKEGLNNAVKYSKADNIAVSFTRQNNHFEMKIKDDGVGFDTSETDRFGNGLHNMPYRMELCGCTYRINASPGKGCEIIVSGDLGHMNNDLRK